MDCDWRNRELKANNYLESLMSLASNVDCIELAVPPQTSGIQGVPPLLAMMISSLRTSDVLPMSIIVFAAGRLFLLRNLFVAHIP
jgi:hypothetical protein